MATAMEREQSATPAGLTVAGQAALERATWLAGVLWLLAGVLAALFVVRGPAGADGIDVIFGIAAGLAWPLYEVTGDLDRLRLRRIVPAPEAVQPARGRPARFALGVAAAGAAVLAIVYLALPPDALDVSVAGLTVALVFALATTGRAAQLWVGATAPRRAPAVSQR